MPLNVQEGAFWFSLKFRSSKVKTLENFHQKLFEVDVIYTR